MFEAGQLTDSGQRVSKPISDGDAITYRDQLPANENGGADVDPVPCIGFILAPMRTGQLAANAGVNIQTVRFYERRGILPRPGRTASGYRVYSAEAVRMIRFIKRAQDLGFTLDEIEDLLRLRNDRRASCADVRKAGEAKMAAVEMKIASLEAMKRALAVLLASCARNDRDRACPILEALEVGDESRGRST